MMLQRAQIPQNLVNNELIIHLSHLNCGVRTSEQCTISTW